MASVDILALEAVKTHYFGLASKFMDEFGSVNPKIDGVRIRGTKIESVTPFPLGRNYQQVFGQILEKAISKFPVAVSLIEHWTAPDSRYAASQHPDRKEFVSLQIYSNGKCYLAQFPIERIPTRLLDSPLVECAAMPMGRFAPGGMDGVGAMQIKRALNHLRTLLEPGDVDERWLDSVRQLFAVLLSSGDVSPIIDILYSVDLPANKAGKAIEVFDVMLTSRPGKDVAATTGMTARNAWLAGVRLRCETALGSSPPDPRPIVDWFAEQLRQRLVPYTPFYVAPRGDLIALKDYLPISVLGRLLIPALSWMQDTGDSDPEIAAYLNEVNEAEFTSPRYDSFGLPLNFIAFAVGFDPETESTSPLIQRANWAIDETSILLTAQEAADATGAHFGIALQVLGVEPIHLAMRRMHETRRRDEIAAAMADLRGYQPGDLTVEITAVKIRKPIPAEQIFALVLAPDGRIIAPWATQRQPHEQFPEWLHAVGEVFRSHGVQDIQTWPTWLEVSEAPHDPYNPLARFFPDFNGGWIDVTADTLRSARGFLKQGNWEYIDETTFNDPRVQSLPYPHRLARAGIQEVMQKHYTQQAYRLIRDKLSDRSIPSDLVWDRVCETEPRFSQFMKDFPNWSIPQELEVESLRVIWGKAPTLITTSALSERLEATDIDLQVAAQFVRLPHGIAYLHFARAPEAARLEFEDEGKSFSMDLEGAFLEEYSTPAGSRMLVLMPIWTDMSHQYGSQYAVLRLLIDEEMTPLSHYLDENYRDEDVAPEVVASNRVAVEEIAKVLIYLNLKSARIVEKPQRSTMLRGMNKKSAEHQLKLLDKAKGTCDYLSVGPEQAMSSIQASGMSGATKAPHLRRGFVNTYHVGKGRKELVLRFIEPVIVNKHLLGEDVPIPTPKNYRLK